MKYYIYNKLKEVTYEKGKILSIVRFNVSTTDRL